MRAGFIVTGVLGIGTALVFAAAALVSLAFPNGSTVAAGWNGGLSTKGDLMMPAPAPIMIDANGGGVTIQPNVAPAEK